MSSVSARSLQPPPLPKSTWVPGRSSLQQARKCTPFFSLFSTGAPAVGRPFGTATSPWPPHAAKRRRRRRRHNNLAQRATRTLLFSLIPISPVSRSLLCRQITRKKERKKERENTRMALLALTPGARCQLRPPASSASQHPAERTDEMNRHMWREQE